ncbi:unnamed protein product, partial [Laminaria digitata]
MKIKTMMAVLLVSTMALSACGKDYVKTSEGLILEKSKARPTLLVTMGMHNEDTGEESMLKAAAAASNNQNIDTVGQDAFNQIKGLLAEDGFVLTLDAEQAKKHGTSKMAENESMQKMAGYWYHPDCSSNSFNYGVLGLNMETIALNLRDPENLDEHFASVDVSVGEGSGFSIGRIGRFYPIVTISIRIIDNAGKEVYRARYRGKGDKNFLVADRSPSNMKLAISRAL